MKKPVRALILCALLLCALWPVLPVSAEGSLPPLINTPSPRAGDTGSDAPAAEEAEELPAEPQESEPEPLLRIHQIDIGCADAYLLTVDGIVILVDCGSDTMLPISGGYHNYQLLEYLEASGIDHVDAHFVTHWHNDHCYNVNVLGELYGTADTVVYGTSPELFPELSPLAAGTYRQLKDGDQLTIGPLDILCVGPPYRENIAGTTNGDSLNFIVTYGHVRTLFTGDFILTSILKRWRNEITDLDILSFPHHGIGLNEQSPDVYRVISPRLVFIPSHEGWKVRDWAVNTVLSKQDAVFCSSRSGHALATTDGENIWYSTGVAPGETPLGTLLPPRGAKK